MTQLRQFHRKRLHVPFIAPWTGEQTQPGKVVLRRGRGGEGIGYADEVSHVDRRYGALWTDGANRSADVSAFTRQLYGSEASYTP